MKTKIYIDQMHRVVEIPELPNRIISLVPSLTELLFDLGLSHRMVGVTKFCVRPKNQVKKIPKIGGTKTFKFDVIRSLKPDLIIGNKEENYKDGIEELTKYFPVWMSTIDTLSDAYQAILEIGKITQKQSEAQQLIHDIKSHFSPIRLPDIRGLYLIWKKPYIAVGKNTFIDEMLPFCGIQNAITQSRYPEISEQIIHDLHPEVIFLSSEPYPFKQEHVGEITSISPNSKIILVDGELFSWYGSRLRFSGDYFQQLSIQIRQKE